MIRTRRYLNNTLLHGISEEAQNKLTTARVLVMGAGGLGSGVIMNLAAMGIGQIKLIDDGIVEEDDFNAQFIHKYQNIGRAKVMSAKAWISEFNPDIIVKLDKANLSAMNYFNYIRGYDIIVDCFDSYEAKYMLNDIALAHKLVLVHGAVQGFCGQVTTIIPEQTGCLACVMPKSKEKRNENFASISPVTNIIASLQAQEVLKLVTGTGELLANKLLMYDGLTTTFKTLNYSKNIACESCRERLF